MDALTIKLFKTKKFIDSVIKNQVTLNKFY